jgi:hypothetical protein
MTDDREDEGSSRVPYDTSAERALLGAAILSDKARAVMVRETRPEDFHVPKHQHIAAALGAMLAEDLPVDPVTLADVLRSRKVLDDVGGPSVLIGLQADTPATSSASRYARIVHDKATLRRLAAAGEELRELAFDPQADAHDAVVRAQERLSHVSANNGSRSYSALEIADVGALIDGGLEVEEADFLTRTDGKSLLYAGKVHMLQAEPSAGKTWLALAAVLELLEVGGSAVFLDYEDTPRGVLGRLLALGADPVAVRERFRVAQLAGGYGPAEQLELSAMLADLNPDLVVIDGVAVALTRDGLSEDSATEFLEWFERMPNPIARTGAAVLLLDHVAKDKESQGRWARGTGAKLGAIDGAAYHVKVASAFSRRRAGIVRLVIAKDRPGGVGAIGETAAIGYVEPHADGARVLVRLEPDTGDRKVSDVWKPTVLMRRVSEELEKSGKPLSARTLKALVHSEKPKLLEEAISRLEQEGYIARTKLGRSTAYEHVKPYTEPDPGPTRGSSSEPEELLEPPPGLFDGSDPDDDDPPPDPGNVTSLEDWKKDNF